MLKISENQRYFEEDGKPFFWLADTAWLLYYKLDEADIYTYLRNRSEKGYNVILTNMLHDSGDVSVDAVTGEIDLTNEAHWHKIEKTIEIAEQLGIYIGLLPAWGSIVKEGILTMDNIEAYADYIGQRYSRFSNVIWVLGGDIRGEAYKDIYNKEASVLKAYNPERLMAFHPFGRTSSSLWFQDANWLDFNMFQSGHRRYDQQQLGEWDDAIANEVFYGEDNWRYVEEDLKIPKIKPTLDAEPSYEGIPQGLHNPHNPFWEEWDARRYAYWAVFEGAAGHTYGNNAIMQFHDDMQVAGAYGVREVWQDAMHHSGGSQMKYLKELMLSVDYMNGKSKDSLLLYGQKERYHRVSVFAGEAFVYCYSYLGDQFMLDLTEYKDKEMEAYWMNPQDGTYSYIETIKGKDKILVSPIRRKCNANDWVYILKSK